MSFAIFAAPAQAQDGPQVDIYGYVAPRCWVAKAPSGIEMVEARPRVICNQAAPKLASSVRALKVDGTLAERAQPTVPGQLSGRKALEIIVSPQI